MRIATIFTVLATLCATAEARFLQTDPVGYKDDLTLYSFNRNDPVNRMDSGGTWSEKVHNKLYTDAFGAKMAAGMRLMSIGQDLPSFVVGGGDTVPGNRNESHYLRDPGQSVESAKQRYSDFVQRNLDTARSARLSGQSDKIVRSFFTAAAHALADARSPVHNQNGDPAEYDTHGDNPGHSPTDDEGDEGTDDLTEENHDEIVSVLRQAYEYVYGNGARPDALPPNARRKNEDQTCGVKSTTLCLKEATEGRR